MPDERIRLVHASGECEIDLARRELRVRGSPVPLGGRAFEIIEVLAESAGHLVTKDGLMNRIWPGAIVLDNTLQVHVMAARKALGTYRSLLKTESGRGYRLLGDWTAQEQRLASLSVVPEAEKRESPRTPLTNVPPMVADLIGRTAAVELVGDLISAYRVVTLTGPGGIGKTALALHVARGSLVAFADGVWLIELGSLSDPELVASAIAADLGLKPGVDAITALSVARAIAEKQLLLVLDNCEHVIDAVADLVETVVRLCAGVTVLVTSREILRVAGERVYRVPPLDVPPRHMEDANDILGHSAVHLFVKRTQALRGDCSPLGEELSAMAAISRRLDGIPLAIEFAAARAAMLGSHEVAARLDDRFGLLTSGRRTALPRHRTLRATLDWSHELLSAAERRLLRRLAVFQGGFTLEAATAIMQDIGGANTAVADDFANLVAKSLVTLDRSPHADRWQLLETIRAYALEKLGKGDEAKQVAQRHAEYYRDLLGRAAAELRPAGNDIARKALEIDNVRAALEWAYAPDGDATIGAILTAAFAPVWFNLALLFECRERTERAVNGLTPNADLSQRVRSLLHLEYGIALLLTMGSAEMARTVLRNAVEYAEGLDDPNTEMRAHWASWVMHSMQGDVYGLRSAAERFSHVAHRTADEAAVLFSDRMIGVSLQFLGRPVESRPWLERVLERHVEATTPDRSFWLWANYDPRVLTGAMLARVLWLQGSIDQAVARATTSIRLAEAAGNVFSHCEVLYFATFPIALYTGDLETARRALAALIELSTINDLPMHRIWARSMEATVLIRTGEFAAGMAILGTVLDSAEESGWAKFQPQFLGVYAEGLAGSGRHTEALALIDQAIAKAEATGDLEHLAELFRLKGEFLQEKAGEQASAAAEACFAKALTVAEEQGTLFWQLRAAISLARQKARQGRPGEARRWLAPVYEQFTKGSGAADLEAARALLDTLE